MMNKYMALAPTKKLLPNWALAGVLSTLVGASYFYSIRAVGDDSAQELQREFERQSDAAKKAAERS